MKKSGALKIVAVLIAILFTITSVSWAQPHKVYTLTVPEEIGQVKERYQGTSDEVIVHIQDAHTSYEAQKNLCNIIEYLVNERGVKTIAAEGAEGTADLTTLRKIPVLDSKRAVAQHLMKNGLLTGTEVAHVMSPDYFHLFGIEDMDLYNINYEAFVNTLNKREDILEQIEQVESILNDLKVPLYSERVAVFDSVVDQYRSGGINFFEYCGKLLSNAGGVGIDISQYVNFTMLLEAKSWEEQIDFDKVDDERDQVIQIVTMNLIGSGDSLSQKKQDIFERHRRQFEQSENKKGVSNTQFYTLLKNFASEYRIDYEQAKNFYNFASYLSLFSRLDKSGLLGECKTLQREIEDRLPVKKEEKELINLSRHIRLLKDIVELKVLPEDVTYYRNNKEQFSALVFESFIKKNTSEKTIGQSIALLDEILPSVDDFYKFAEERSKVLTEKALAELERSTETVLPLVAGGFHTDGITQLLKEKGVSYLVITPAIEKALEDVPYLDRMLKVKTSFELMIEAAYNAIVKPGFEEAQAEYKRLVAEYKAAVATREKAESESVQAADLPAVPSPPPPLSPEATILTEFIQEMQDRYLAFFYRQQQTEGEMEQLTEKLIQEAPEALTLVGLELFRDVGVTLEDVSIDLYRGKVAGVTEIEEAQWAQVAFIQRRIVQDPAVAQPVEIYKITFLNGMTELVTQPDSINNIQDAIAHQSITHIDIDPVEAFAATIVKAARKILGPGIDLKEVFEKNPKALAQVLFPHTIDSSAFSLTGTTISNAAKEKAKEIIATHADKTVNMTQVLRNATQTLSSKGALQRAKEVTAASFSHVIEKQVEKVEQAKINVLVALATLQSLLDRDYNLILEAKGVTVEDLEDPERTSIIEQAITVKSALDSDIIDTFFKLVDNPQTFNAMDYAGISEETKEPWSVVQKALSNIQDVIRIPEAEVEQRLINEIAQTARITQASLKQASGEKVQTLAQIVKLNGAIDAINQLIKQQRRIGLDIVQPYLVPLEVNPAVELEQLNQQLANRIALVNAIADNVSSLTKLNAMVSAVKPVIESQLRDRAFEGVQFNTLRMSLGVLRASLSLRINERLEASELNAHVIDAVKNVEAIASSFSTFAKAPQTFDVTTAPATMRPALNVLKETAHRAVVNQIAQTIQTVEAEETAIARATPKVSTVAAEPIQTETLLSRANAVVQEITKERAQLPADSLAVRDVDALRELLEVTVDELVTPEEMEKQVAQELVRIEGILTFFDFIEQQFGETYQLKFLAPEALQEFHKTTVKTRVEGKDYNLSQLIIYPDHETNTAYINIAYVNAFLKATVQSIDTVTGQPTFDGIAMLKGIVSKDLYELQNPPATTEDGVIIADVDEYQLESYNAAQLQAGTFAATSVMQGAVDEVSGTIDVADTLKIYKEVEKFVELTPKTTLGLPRGASIPQEISEVDAPQASSILVIQLDDSLIPDPQELQKLHGGAFQNRVVKIMQSQLMEDLRATILAYPMVHQNIYITVDFSDLDLTTKQNAILKRVIDEVIAAPINATVVEHSYRPLLDHYLDQDETKIIMGSKVKLEKRIETLGAELRGQVFGVSIQVPDEIAGEGIQTLPLAYITTCALPLVEANPEDMEKGFLKRIEGTPIWEINPNAIGFDINTLIAAIKKILQPMNAELTQQRREARTIYVAA